MPARTGSAEIVGAGIGGLTAAAALAREGWRVRIHERDPEVRAFGSGIYLWDNGLAVLDDLDVIAATVADAHVGPAIETRDHRNRTVSAVTVNTATGPTVVTVMRQRLISSLLHAARREGAEVVTGSTVTSVTASGTLTSPGGGTWDADLVVVADGAGSRLRDQLGLLRRRRHLGQTCSRFMVPRHEGLVPPGDADKYVEHMAGQRFLLHTPVSREETYIALVCPVDDHEAMGDPFPREVWARSFPHLTPLLGALTTATRWDEFETVDLTTWSSGRVAVIGDAAHAQPPYLGQGGGCAMMNAVGLAHAVSFGTGDLTRRLRAWESTERPLIEHTQRFSHRVAQLNRVPDGPRSVLLNALGRSKALSRSRLRAATAQPTGTGTLDPALA